MGITTSRSWLVLVGKASIPLTARNPLAHNEKHDSRSSLCPAR